MSIAKTLLSEFETQAPITRKFLERLPEEKFLWRPHERSWTAGQLAFHLAVVPGSVVKGAQLNPAPSPDFNNRPSPTSHAELLQTFDDSVATVRNTLPGWNDRYMEEIWRLGGGDQEIAAMPRKEFLRQIMLNHWYQHRGQFAVYLRMLDIPVPASWGPSADEPPNMPQ